MGFNKNQIEIDKDFQDLCFIKKEKSIFWLIGGAGGGKTFYPLALFHRLCLIFDGVRFVVIRKTEKILKATTIPSYNQMQRALGCLDKNGKPSIKIVDMRAKYPNNSEILFRWADLSKDKDNDNIKGLEPTAVLIEEANQIDLSIYNTLLTRMGRWNKDILHTPTGKKIDIPAFMFCTCNPNNSWVKSEIYDKWQDDTLKKNIYVNNSTPYDNEKNLGQGYIEQLANLPEKIRNRYLQGEWEYENDPAQLIRYEWIKNCRREKFDEAFILGRRVLALDPADSGKDTSNFCYMIDNCVIRFETYTGLNPTELGKLAVEKAKGFGIDKKSKDLIIDAIGIGSGVCSTVEDLGFECTRFKGSETAGTINANGKKKKRRTSYGFSFLNTRAEAGWTVRELMQKEQLEIITDRDLEQEMMAHHFDDQDKEIKLRKKDEVKALIGRSPDKMDSLSMAVWLVYCLITPRFRPTII